MSDEELWRRALTGDGRAFGLLFEQHRDRVFRHLLRFVDRTEAEDLTATVFLELWRARSRVRLVDESLLPWLLATATNTARNAARARRRFRLFLSQLPPPGVVDDHAEEVAERSERHSLIKRLSAAVDGLSIMDQQLLTLTSWEGFTTAQAAQAVGISPGAARTRLSRARKRLTTTLSSQLQPGTERNV